MSVDQFVSSPAAIWTSPVAPALDRGPPLFRFSVEQYHRLGEIGVLPGVPRTELVQGLVTCMSPIGAAHATTVMLLYSLLGEMLRPGWHVRCQQPLSLAASELEPDLAVVRGAVRDFSRQHPTAAQTGLIVEVADSSLDFDRTVKLPLFAAAGIPQYWIVDLVKRRLEVYSLPQGEGLGAHYAACEVYTERQVVSVVLDGSPLGEFAPAAVLP